MCSPSSSFSGLAVARIVAPTSSWKPREASVPESRGPSLKRGGGGWRTLSERPARVQTRTASKVQTGSTSATRKYVARRRSEDCSNRELRRCLKRYVFRAIFRELQDRDGLTPGTEASFA